MHTLICNYKYLNRMIKLKKNQVLMCGNDYKCRWEFLFIIFTSIGGTKLYFDEWVCLVK